MKIKILLIAFVLAASGCKKNGGSDNAEKVLLRLKLAEGFEQQVTYRVSSDDNPNYFIDHITSFTTRLDSVKNNGKEYLFSVTTDRLRVTTKMMDSFEQYDSAKKEETMTPDELSFHNDFRDILTTPLTYTLGDRGQVIKGFAFKDNAHPAEDLIDLYNFQIVFPEEAVGINDTWSDERILKVLTAESHTETKYTIKDITAEDVVISVETKLGGVKGLTADNTSTAEYIIDRKTGALKSSLMKMKTDQGGGITMTTSFTTTLK